MPNMVINSFFRASDECQMLKSHVNKVFLTCLADSASHVSSSLCFLPGTSSMIIVDELELESDVSEEDDDKDQSENSKGIKNMLN